MPDQQEAPPARRTAKAKIPMPPVDPSEFFLTVMGQLAGSMGPNVCADSTLRAISNHQNGKKLYRAYHKLVTDANAAIADGTLLEG